MVTSNPHSPRKVKKTTSEIVPEVKLQEPITKKRYHRNSEQFWIWTIIRIIVVICMIIWAFMAGVRVWFGDFKATLWWTKSTSYIDPHIEHCKLMPDMDECKKFATWKIIENTQDDTEHWEYCKTHEKLLECAKYATELVSWISAKLRIEDMWTLLEWKTWDELDRDFLEMMILYRKWVIEAANHLSLSSRKELQALWENLIKSQVKEIDIMEKWQKDWGFNTSGSLLPPPTTTPQDKIIL